MDLREKVLYQQIHLLKLATDISVTPLLLYYLSEHRIAPALLIGFVPPVAVWRSRPGICIFPSITCNRSPNRLKN
jgi:hypothetical protein